MTKSVAVRMGFERESRRISISSIRPLHLVSPAVRQSTKFAQISASIREVGIIEPPVVAADRTSPGTFLLLDGHLRLEILKDLGETEVVCLISTDDEGFTYNKRLSRLAMVQEHKMIVKAAERGVSPARLAAALNLDVKTLAQRLTLLKGICDEAADILRTKHVPILTFGVLRKMGSLRQIEAAELMVAMNTFTGTYAKSLLAATPQSQLAQPDKPKTISGLSGEQISMMEKETANLDRAFKMAEQSYGTDHLDLVLAKGYLGKLLCNARIVRYLAQHHREILAEFQKLADSEPAKA
ncbi:MAG TPA: plasmid partitioning protein RepB C-terminal domain-containing protein [Rhizomicrobium sp.]|nr:plasmid partitioning protein RepB C-terminal domain-containing protein [Rhizomicrobium sp.]